MRPFSKSVKFLGHVISEKGIAKDPDKVQSVVDWHPPKTKKQVRSFLGIVKYCSCFIRNYAMYALLLHELKKTEIRFKWTDVHDKAFKTLTT